MSGVAAERLVVGLRQVLEDLGMGAARVESDTLLSDLGLGSLELLEVKLRLEDVLEQPLSDRGLLEARTVADLATLLEPGAEQPPPLPTLQQPSSEMPPVVTARRLGDLLANRIGTAITFLEGNEAVSWEQLREAARQAAGAFSEYGLGSGDTVAIMLPTGLPFVAAFFGAALLGAVPVPLYPPLRPDELLSFVARQAPILRNAGTRLLVTATEAAPLARVLRGHAGGVEHILTPERLRGPSLLSFPVPEENAPAMIQYTSGSTAAPRGVVLSHRSLLANIRSFRDAVEVSSADRVVSWLPLYHDMGLIGMLLGSLAYGVPLFLLAPQDFLARPSRWLRAIHEHRGTISAAPNFGYEICARKVPDREMEGLDLSTWHVAGNGSEAVHADTLRRFEARFAPCGFRRSAWRPAYGLAEATLLISVTPRRDTPRVDDNGVVSCGPPAAGVTVRALDERLQFRSTGAFSGYHDNAAATAEVMQDGWIDTGDLGYLKDGEIYVTGRRKALILVGGRNIHAEAVERVASQVRGVRAGCVAAFGVEDAEHGSERLVVVAEARPDASADVVAGVRRAVSNAVGLVADVVVVPAGSIPKTPSGKIRRSACRDRYLSHSLGKRVPRFAQMGRLLAGSAPWWLQQAASWLYGLWAGTCVAVYWTLLHIAACMPGAAPRLAGPASRLLFAITGFRLMVRGTPPREGPLMVVANHGSVMDPVVLMAVLGGHIRVVAAPWVAAHPWLRFAMRGLRSLRVKRGDPQQAHQEVEQMIAALQAGDTVLAFAEGGVEAAPGLRPFLLGPFQAAAAAGVPVLPISIHGTRQALRWGQLIPRPGLITVTIAGPLSPSGSRFADMLTLSRQARRIIHATCAEPLVDQRLQRAD